MQKNLDKEPVCCETVEVHEDLLRIVEQTMPEETELYDLAELFRVFGDSTRIRILFVQSISHFFLIFFRTQSLLLFWIRQETTL